MFITFHISTLVLIVLAALVVGVCFAISLSSSGVDPYDYQEIDMLSKKDEKEFQQWMKEHVEKNPKDWPLIGGHDREDYWARLAWKAKCERSK